MKPTISILLAIVLVSLFCASGCRQQKDVQAAFMTKSSVREMMKWDGGKESVDGWLELPTRRVKFEGSERDYWIYTDLNKDGTIDQKEHRYLRPSLQSGYLPRFYPATDLQILLDGTWKTIQTRSHFEAVPGYVFEKGKWRPE